MSAAPVLVTGGAGYIGSHTTLCLLQAGFDVVVLDNLSNSSPESLRRVAELAGRAPVFVEADLRDRQALENVFSQYRPASVVHFAGLKAVGESVEQPLRYYENNVQGSLALFEAMQAHDCAQLVFSSSATVYGDPESLPIDESESIKPTNPYGQTKAMIERIILDWGQAWPALRGLLLRYFNPVGAHPSGRIGEDPQGIPNNLVPFISQVAVGRREALQIFGSDWPTPDGTGVRDYIHVMDLAEGHLAALRALDGLNGVQPVNLGTGQGTSVREMVDQFARASSREIPVVEAPRRAGDIATCYADPGHAAQLLNWRARRGVDEMCADTWRWQRDNPQGFKI